VQHPDISHFVYFLFFFLTNATNSKKMATVLEGFTKCPILTPIRQRGRRPHIGKMSEKPSWLQGVSIFGTVLPFFFKDSHSRRLLFSVAASARLSTECSDCVSPELCYLSTHALHAVRLLPYPRDNRALSYILCLLIPHPLLFLPLPANIFFLSLPPPDS